MPEILRSGSRHRRTPVLLVTASVLAAVALCPVRCIARVEHPATPPPCHQQQGDAASGSHSAAGCQCPALIAIMDGASRPDGPATPMQVAAVESAVIAVLAGAAAAGHSPAACGGPEGTGPPLYLRLLALRI